MREILFRGKRLDNGEWIEGSLLGRQIIIPKGQIMYVTPNKQLIVPGVFAYPVDPATVAQYTGIRDRNGKRIFEEDILDEGMYVRLKRNVSDSHPVYALVSSTEERDWHIMYNFWDGEEYEVIGNIHDNPELLGGNEHD